MKKKPKKSAKKSVKKAASKKETTIKDLLPHAAEFHQALVPELRQYLNKRCISDAVIDKRLIGIGRCYGKVWVTIPIFDTGGKAVQMILRRLPHVQQGQLRYRLPNGSSSVLFGADSLASDPDIILCCEGVPDALAGESLGLCTISGTTGVKTFRDEWLDLIPKTKKDRRFIVCFDTDEAGVNGAAALLLRVAAVRPDLELCQIKLPSMQDGKDLTDFLMQCKDLDKKQALLALARPYTPPTPRDKLIDDLSNETAISVCAPSQGICGEWGYYVVTLRHEGKTTPFVVTSERDCFECLPEPWIERGYALDREPMADSEARWLQRQLVQFLQKEGELMSLADIIILVRQKLTQYVDFTDTRCFGVIAVWIIMTYFYQLCPAVPYLHLTGLKGSRKTKVMQLIALLGFNGELVTSTSSPASITRLVHSSGATLGVDEAENLWNLKDENASALQDVLRSGYKKGIFVTKCEKTAAGAHIVVRFDPFSPKALSGIRGLEDALSSRCIEILMLRTTNRLVANAEVVPSSSEWRDLRALLYPAALVMMPKVQEALENFTVDQLSGRDAELWKPLLLLAQLSDLPDLQQELFSYALEQSAKRKANDTDAESGKVLLCIHELLYAKTKNFITAESIFEELTKDDDFSWISESKNKSGRGKWLNARLKRLGLWDGPADLRSLEGKKKRGYEIELAKIQAAAERLGIALTPPESVPLVTDA